MKKKEFDVYNFLYLYQFISVFIYTTFVGLVWFYGISTVVGYLMPNLFYTYKQFYFKQLSLA